MRTPGVLTVTGIGLLLTVGLTGCDGGASNDREADTAHARTAEDGSHDANGEHETAEHHEGEGHHAEHQHEAGTAHGESDSQATTETGQKTCPVMGDPIDPNVFVEHEGRKIYFCCKDCIKKFKANPDKYLAKSNHEDH